MTTSGIRFCFPAALLAVVVCAWSPPARADDDEAQPQGDAAPDAPVDTPADSSGDAPAGDGAAADSGATADATDICNEGNARIIDGDQTYPAPPGMRFRNYLQRKCKFWPSYSLMTQVGSVSAARPKAARRSMVVIHETLGDKGYWNRSKYIVHFLVDWDGTVYQMMDLARWSPHASNTWISERSIGIEVANLFQAEDCPSNRECLDFDSAKGKAQWVLARQPQMEKLHLLVQNLLLRTNVTNRWLPTEYDRPSDGSSWFLIGMRGGLAHFGDPPSCGAPVSRLERAVCGQGGILSHSNIFEREIDGAAPLLYAWLRQGGKGQRDAWDYMKCMLLQPVENATDPGFAAQFDLKAKRHYAITPMLVPIGSLGNVCGSGAVPTKPLSTPAGAAPDAAPSSSDDNGASDNAASNSDNNDSASDSSDE